MLTVAVNSNRNPPGRVGQATGEEPGFVDRVSATLMSVVPPSAERYLGIDGSNRSLKAVPIRRTRVDVEAGRTDEDVVFRFLDANGRRAKRATIACRTDWSEAKASRLPSEMEAAGEIERYRIGREKVVRRVDRERGVLAFSAGCRTIESRFLLVHSPGKHCHEPPTDHGADPGPVDGRVLGRVRHLRDLTPRRRKGWTPRRPVESGAYVGPTRPCGRSKVSS
jgi:hypothetical protein